MATLADLARALKSLDLETDGSSGEGDNWARGNYGANYYAAFVVDPDGYRIEGLLRPH